MTRAIVKPTRRQLRIALAELLSLYSHIKGLETGGKLCHASSERISARPDSSRRAGPLTEPDLTWLNNGKPAWKFYALPDARVSGKLTPGLRLAESVVICSDPSDNIGFLDPIRFLNLLAESFAPIDSNRILSLARDLSLQPAPLPDCQFTGKVIENREFVKDHFSLRIRAGLVQRPVPGQFLQLMCDPAPHAQAAIYRSRAYREGIRPKLQGIELLDQRPFLRRPFSVASYGPSSQRPGAKNEPRYGGELIRLVNWLESDFEVIYRRLPGGPGTNALAKFETGDKINVVGPLGKGFSLSPAPKVALLVGGGIGAPPLCFLAEELLGSGVEVNIFLGAVTKSRLPFEMRGSRKERVMRFRRMGLNHVVCTDDGSAGRKRLVTELLAEYLERNQENLASSRIFACGPRPMLAALEGLATHYNLSCEALFEERMACGFGACISCVCAVKEPGRKAKFTRICTEGPAFDVRTVMWNA